MAHAEVRALGAAASKKVKDCEIGAVIDIRAIVVDVKENGQAMLLVPGIGRSGQWSIVNTADCRVVGHIVDLLQHAP